MAIRFGRDCLATARLGRILASGVRRDFRRGASFRIGHDRGLVRFARREVGPKLDHVAHDLAARHLALEFVGRKPLHFRCSGSIFLVFRSHRLGWDQSGRGRKRIRDRDRRLAVRRPQATYALVLNITGRAASEPSSSSCRVVGALKVIRPAYPSTGFEGLTLWVFFGYSLVGIVTLVVVVVALLLLRRPPVYRPPPPPLGRCPQCGEPLVPELAGAPWKCPRCGWQ